MNGRHHSKAKTHSIAKIDAARQYEGNSIHIFPAFAAEEWKKTVHLYT